MTSLLFSDFIIDKTHNTFDHYHDKVTSILSKLRFKLRDKEGSLGVTACADYFSMSQFSTGI